VFIASFSDLASSDFEIEYIMSPVITNKKPLPSSLRNGNHNVAIGKGTALSNHEIVELLKKPPKSVPVLRTKSSFQEFFKGIDARRFKSLLHEAFSDITDSAERENKVNRRLELMDGVL
jgi:hypothetical protein